MNGGRTLALEDKVTEVLVTCAYGVKSQMQVLYDTKRYPVDETKKVFSNMDWITTELRNEVVELFPTREDIDASNGNCRDSAVFAKNISIMFLVGRIFTVTSSLIRLLICFAMHDLLRSLIQESILDVILDSQFTVTVPDYVMMNQ
eukprot:78316-Ditylum_brightwellii.AAC.1